MFFTLSRPLVAGVVLLVLAGSIVSLLGSGYGSSQTSVSGSSDSAPTEEVNSDEAESGGLYPSVERDLDSPVEESDAEFERQSIESPMNGGEEAGLGVDRTVHGKVVFPPSLPSGEPCELVVRVSSGDDSVEAGGRSAYELLGRSKVMEDGTFEFELPMDVQTCTVRILADRLFGAFYFSALDLQYWKESGGLVVTPSLGAHLTVQFKPRIGSNTDFLREVIGLEFFAGSPLSDEDGSGPWVEPVIPESFPVRDDYQLRLRGVAPGPFELYQLERLESRDTEWPSRSSGFDSLDAAPGQRTRLRAGEYEVWSVQLNQHATLRGRVADEDGEPIHDARIHMKYVHQGTAASDRDASNCDSDEDGEFTIEYPPDASVLLVHASSDGYASRWFTGPDVLEELPRVEDLCVIVLEEESPSEKPRRGKKAAFEPGALECQLVTAGGNAITDVNVWIRRNPGRRRIGSRLRLDQHADRYSLTGIAPGMYRIEVEGRELTVAQPVDVQILPGEALSAGELVVVEGVELKVIPTSQSNGDDAPVWLSHLKGQYTRPSESLRKENIHSFGFVEPGEVLLSTEYAELGHRIVSYVVTEGSANTVDLNGLPPAVTRMTCTVSSGGTPMSGVTVHVEASDQVIIRGRTDIAGEVTFLHELVGSIQLHAPAYGTRWSVAIPEGEAEARVRVELPSGSLWVPFPLSFAPWGHACSLIRESDADQLESGLETFRQLNDLTIQGAMRFHDRLFMEFVESGRYRLIVTERLDGGRVRLVDQTAPFETSGSKGEVIRPVWE